jgi:outer membrane protein TolC
VLANSITFEGVVQKSIKNNLELQILDSKKEVAKASIDEIDALYYPKVSLGFNTQYTKDLEKSSGISSIGGSFLSDSSGYESSSTFRVEYEVYNFGVTDTKIDIATIKKDKVEYERKEKVQEFKLKLLEIYGKVLDDKIQLFYYQKIQELNRDIYKLYKRLFDAKKIDKLTIANQAIKIIELDTKIVQVKDNLKKLFVELGYYTHDTYTLSNNFEHLKLIKQNDIVYEESVIYKKQALEIKQKEKEIKQLKKELYPSIKLFSTYNLYEKDNDHLDKSFKLDERNYVIGLGINIVLFEGFKFDATKRKLQAELKQLNLQNKHYEEQYYLQKKANQKEFIQIKDNIVNVSHSVEKYKSRTKTFEELNDVNNIDTIKVLNNEINNYEKDLELQTIKIKKNIKLKEMQILGTKVEHSMIQEVEMQIKSKNRYTHKTLKESNIRQSPFLTGNIIKTVAANTSISIEYCNSYDWCKLEDDEAYIAKFLIVGL